MLTASASIRFRRATSPVDAANISAQVWVTGTDIELVGRSAALISQSCLAKNKDIRKFLDGARARRGDNPGKFTSQFN